MATNFPTSLDALTNPTSSDSLASPSHADQHANANDAIEALQAKVGVNGSAVTTSLDYRVGLFSGRNAIINGAMNVWQRGTSFNGSSPYYGADRWFFARPGAVAGSTLSRQASGLTGFTYCARMQRDSGNTNTSAVRIFQSLETINSLQFAGKQITVSFYVRSGANYSGGATTYLNIGSGTGTDQQLGNTGFTGYALVGQLATITPTSTWTRYSVTGSVSSSATQVGIDLGYTPTSTAGANDYIEITGVQLEAGAVATPFEFEDYQVTLAKCQRYYGRYILDFAANSNGSALSRVSFNTRMRATPSITQIQNNANYGSQNVTTTTTNYIVSADGCSGYRAASVAGYVQWSELFEASIEL